MKQHDLNLVPGGVPAIINVSQYDTGRKWRFNLYYADDVYEIPPGATIRIDGTKPDNKGFSYNQSDDVVESGDDYCIITSTAQMTAVPGDVYCELRVQQGAADIGTANFLLRVEKAAVQQDTDMSETEIPAIVDAATQQMIAAARSAEAAKASETAAKASEEAAAGSAAAAQLSEQHAQSFMITAETAADIAKSWATYSDNPNVRGSDTDNSQYWSDQSKNSATSAQSSLTMAEAAKNAAALSAAAALASETAAKASEDAAKASEDAAKASEDAAKDSETAAKASETKAKDSEEAAKASEDAAKTSEDAAKELETKAKASETKAKESETEAAGSAAAALLSEQHAQSSMTTAEAAKELAMLWAEGPGGTGTPSATNNAQYWAHEAQSAAGGGVTSWNTRTGGVLPQAGDYSADQIAYDGGYVDEKKADVNSPTLTGEPRSTTPPDGDNSTRIATTEFVYRAGGGSVITVTTSETTLYGKDVTLTDGVETMTETFDASGKAMFRGVRLTGTLTVSSTDGTDTAIKTLTILYYGTYAVNLVFEYATIHITSSDPLLIGQTAYVYQGQSIVGQGTIATGGVDVIVHEKGSYTVKASAHNINTESSVSVTEFFETYNVALALSYATLNISTSETTLYNQAISVKQNSAVIATGTFSSSGSATIYIGQTGSVTVEATDGSETATNTLTVAAGSIYNVVLAFEYATLHVTTTDPLLQSAEVNAVGTSATYTGTFVNGACDIIVKDLDTYTVGASAQGISNATTATVTTFFTTVNVSIALQYATLNITAGETSLYGEDATISYNGTSKTVTLDQNGQGTAYVGYEGSVTVSATDGTDTAETTITTVYGQSYSVSLLFQYATIHCTTTDPLLAGATVTATKGSLTYTGTFVNGACDIIVKETGTYTVATSGSGFSTSTNVNVTAFFGTYNAPLALSYAALNITTTETTLYGKTVTVKNGETEIKTETLSSAGTATIYTDTLATLTVTATDGTDTATKSVTVSAYTTYAVELSFFSYNITTWASGSWEDIASMLEANDRGLIDINDYIKVGDEKQVTINAMAATGVGEAHVQQTATLVIVAKNDKDLSDGSGKCHFVWQLKNGLANGTSGEYGYMNSSNTNVGGWKDCARRTWCNNVFKAALPSDLQSMLKQVKVKTSKGNQQTTFDETDDYIFLPAEKEVFGTTTYSVDGEGVQWPYYETAANRIKKQGDSGSANYWWERSPYASYATNFCSVSSSGGASYDGASDTNLLAPAGCI